MSGDGFLMGIWFIAIGIVGYIVSSNPLIPERGFPKLVAIVCFIAGMGMMLGIIPVTDEEDPQNQIELAEEQK